MGKLKSKKKSGSDVFDFDSFGFWQYDFTSRRGAKWERRKTGKPIPHNNPSVDTFYKDHSFEDKGTEEVSNNQKALLALLLIILLILIIYGLQPTKTGIQH